jgi:hypothetical protein
MDKNFIEKFYHKINLYYCDDKWPNHKEVGRIAKEVVNEMFNEVNDGRII